MSWTEQLISLVQAHPCLYDCNAKDYKNNGKKVMLWKKISRELNQNCETVRTKWKNLKDGYTKYKKNMYGENTSSGKKKTYVNWVWGPYLQFLDGTIQPRSTPANALPGVKTEDGEHSPSFASDSEHSVCNDSVVDIDPEVIISQPSPSYMQMPSPLHYSSRKRKFNDDGDEIQQVIDYFKIQDKKDSVDLLFISYAKTFKKFKPKTQANLKVKLAQIFAEAELNELESENIVSEMSSSSVSSVTNTLKLEQL